MNIILVATIGVILLVAFLLTAAGRAANEQDRTLGTVMPCPRCQTDNPRHANYCARCGAELSARSDD
jgi:hypothetical protein